LAINELICEKSAIKVMMI